MTSSGLPDPSIPRNIETTLARYERLLEIVRQLNSTLRLDLLLEQIVQSAAELTDAEVASILLLDKVTGVLRFEAAIDPEGVALDSIEVPLEGSIAGWVVRFGEPLIIDDASADPRFYRRVDEASEFRTRNLIAVPMRTRDQIIGCLEALNKRDDLSFTQEDLTTLDTMAAQAAVAIENARLFEQSDLIAEMVHELRTPLSAIKATTYILNRPGLSEERRAEMLATIAQETDRLTRLTTEFLDLSRLESGRARLERRLINLNPILSSCVQTVANQAANRQIDLSLETHPLDLPDVLADGEKIRQVLLNLLTNAIKYNREEGTVRVTAQQEDERILISVEDTGQGIREADLPHIFDKFYRVADTEGFISGTGLGLAIAKNIVEGHGGKIWVDSQQGVGTRFTFFIPLPQAQLS